MKRVLLIDDDPEIYLLVSNRLQRDFRFEYARSLEEAQKHLTQPVDLILLDVHLPDGDGFKACASFQNDPKTAGIPIIFLTASDDISDKVMGFSLGADDYVVKPFDVVELHARITAKLKKLEKQTQAADHLTRGDLRAEGPYQRVFLLKNGEEIPVSLTSLEFKVLFHLMKHEDQIFTRNQLIDAIWGHSTHITDRTVDQHVSKIRKKIANSHYTIQARHGSGYCFCKKTNKASAA